MIPRRRLLHVKLVAKCTSVPRRFRTTIPTCPPPEFDTGCTHCMPDMSVFSVPKKKIPPSPFHYRHVIISTGTSDWPSKIDTVQGSLAGLIQKNKRRLFDVERPSLITNCDLAGEAPQSAHSTVTIYPEGVHFPQVPKSMIHEFFKTVVNGSIDQSDRAQFPRERANPIILICGHGARDVRCGAVAPLLVDEFKAVLTKWNLLYDEGINPDGIKVSICSHIGGHAFAGNMIFYPGDGQASIWYGKVFPHHVQGIVHETIVKGNIIEDLLRGTGLPAQDTLSHALASEPEPEPFVPPVTDRI